ncbi:MAG: hypothetical protein HXL34_07045 [Prevotellaceae bacterium]|nr:hypothetical protein [Prevotellaceae bacterium]
MCTALHISSLCSSFGGRQMRVRRSSHPLYGGRRTRCWRPSNTSLQPVKGARLRGRRFAIQGFLRGRNKVKAEGSAQDGIRRKPAERGK